MVGIKTPPRPPCPCCNLFGKEEVKTYKSLFGFFIRKVQMYCSFCGTAGPILPANERNVEYNAEQSWQMIADPDRTWQPSRPPAPKKM